MWGGGAVCTVRGGTLCSSFQVKSGHNNAEYGGLVRGRGYGTLPRVKEEREVDLREVRCFIHGSSLYKATCKERNKPETDHTHGNQGAAVDTSWTSWTRRVTRTELCYWYMVHGTWY